MSASLSEFKFDKESIAEWLPWGGLTLPHVMEQKDGSFFSVIRYEPFSVYQEKILLDRFCRGWSLWIERQHHDGRDENFLVVCWNPFVPSSKNVKNTLGNPVHAEKCLDYFGGEVKNIAQAIADVTEVKVLEYQELLDFLSFCLDFGLHKAVLPEVPLYMDVLLSQDSSFVFEPNGLLIDDRHVLLITLPGLPELKEVFHAFHELQWRYVRRLLCMNEKQAEKDLSRYYSGWCNSRKYVRKGIFKDLMQGDVRGYYHEYMIFLLNDKNYVPFKEYMENLFEHKRINYLNEEYNMKDAWWGSLPGIYRADIDPPAMYFNDLNQLMQHNDEKKKVNKLETAMNQIQRVAVHLEKKGV